jgi:hypothetical protein
MPIDLSREHDDDLIPTGLYKLQAEIMPGGYGDDDLLTLTKRGNLAYLKLKNTIVDGAYAGRQMFDMLNVEQVPNAINGPEQLEKDKRTARRGRSTAKRIVASAHAVDTEHTDTETLSKLLTIASWGDLHGLVYWAELGIEPARNGFKAKNKIDSIVTPADMNWPGAPGQPKLPVRPIAKSKRDEFDDEIPY